MLLRFAHSVGWAVNGIIYALRTQRHMQVHLTATVGVVALGLWFDISSIQWLFVVFAVSLVWVTELLNTGIEAVVDLCTQEYHPLAKVAKDAAAGAVLVAAINALVVAVMVFFPLIIEAVRSWGGN